MYNLLSSTPYTKIVFYNKQPEHTYITMNLISARAPKLHAFDSWLPVGPYASQHACTQVQTDKLAGPRKARSTPPFMATSCLHITIQTTPRHPISTTFLATTPSSS